MSQLSDDVRQLFELLAEGEALSDLAEHFGEGLFAEAAREALRMDDFQRETSSRKAGTTNLRSYEVWTDEDDSRLRKMYEDGASPQEMSEILERHQAAIRRRLHKLGLG